MSVPRWRWSWIEMCGPGGLIPWYPSKHDIGACFQQLFLDIPVLILFAIVSAYYFGSRNDRRNYFHPRKWAVRCRVTCSVIIALVPFTRTVVGLVYAYGLFRPVDYMSTGVELVTWFVHAGYVQSLRHQRNYHGPVIVRVLWTLTAVLSVINLRSHILTYDSTNLMSRLLCGFSSVVVVLQVLYGLTFITLSKESETDSTAGHHTERSPLLGATFFRGFREDLDPDYLGVAMEETTLTSRLIFYWVNPLMQKGSEQKLRSCDDLYDLPPNLTTSYLCAKLHSALQAQSQVYQLMEEVAVVHKASLLRALHACFGFQFYAIGVLRFLGDALGFAGPLILNKLVAYIEDKSEPSEYGYWCAGALFLSALVAAFLNVHFNFLMAKIGLQFRGALISVIYKKTLNLSYSAVNKFSVGEIVNFMSTDTDRIVNSCPSFHSFWSIPFQLAVTFYLLYQQVGIAFLAGVVFTLVLIPINKVIASKIGALSTKLMERKDARVASMAELLRGVRVIKAHVWEEYFLNKILSIRTGELKYLKGRKYLDAMCVYFWATTPVIISILTFSTYSLMGFHLTAATVFTTVALLNMLIAPLNAFPWVLNGLTEAWVSIKRIQRFLDVQDMDLANYFTQLPPTASDTTVFDLKDCAFRWTDVARPDDVITTQPAPAAVPSTARKGKSMVRASIQQDSPSPSPEVSSLRIPMLLIARLTVEEGELLAVTGSVGSGKSTLLAALLGEIDKVNGVVAVKTLGAGVALVTQTPWLQRATLRDNILFGRSYDSNRYQSVLEACCLTEEVEAMQGGDLVMLGEGGVTLSGGQRARVALARAVYQDKDVYLLDDVLAAVDARVARSIYNKVICGLLKDKTRIFCTNTLKLLSNADCVVQIDNGCIVKFGKPNEVLQGLDDLRNMMDCILELEVLCGDEMVVERVESGGVNTAAVADEETSERGVVKLSVYRRYWTSVGHLLAFIILLSVTLMQASRNVTDLWLSSWVAQDSQRNGTFDLELKVLVHRDTTKYYLTTYVLLAVANNIFTLLRAFLFAYGGVYAASKIHRKLVRHITYSTITFFDVSPLGRILNRFSSDSYTVDDSLPFIINILLAQSFGLVGTMVVTMYGLPWLCLLIAPLVPIYHYVQAMYRHASRQLKRLSSVTLSPLYSHFNETLQGLTTIRAFRSSLRFKRVNEDYVECNQKAQFAAQSANQWLALRLQLIGVVLVSGVGIIAVLQHEFDVVDPALVGLAIAYALSVTGMLNGVVNAFVETEKELISLERIGQYMDEVQPELMTGHHPPFAWPSQGVIVFESVYLKYREHLAPSLNGISFETRPAEKLGVVGRTGAGKSSLITALLRLVRVSSGSILIDTVNINHIGLSGLRSRICVIPQDPFLFEGTVRENVDPLEEFTDTEIWSALEKCHMMSTVTDVLGGLKGDLAPEGRNLSQGQRQLLCLVRAVLKNAKIVCIDETTASVDQETDKQIQQTIRSCFRQSTVLTIAHRISTVMDCDRVMVLKDGEVMELDTPENLIDDPTSYFNQLCQESD